MARISRSNILLIGVSGKLGDIVVKQYKYGTVITKLPDMSKVKSTARQKKQRKRFAAAVAYAKSINADPKKKAQYQKKVKKGSTVFHTALREYLNKK
jgi:hypothetical protein